MDDMHKAIAKSDYTQLRFRNTGGRAKTKSRPQTQKKNRAQAHRLARRTYKVKEE